MNDDLTEIRERLARVETKQDGQGTLLEKIDGKLDRMDDRLRNVELKSASIASIAGGLVSVGVTLITAKLKGIT